jgi:polysaccharide export outer membrane protein
MVRVNIQNFQIIVLGEVNQEGMITIRDPEVNIYEALSMAGNMTEMADRTNVKIVRKDGKQANTRYVNLLQEEMLASQNLFLRPGDMIIVPPLKAKERKEYILPAYRTALSVISTTLVFILTIDRLTNLGN